MFDHEDDEMSELVDADFPRIDLVGKAANGTRFLIAKGSEDDTNAGLFSPEFVRGLVTKEQERDENGRFAGGGGSGSGVSQGEAAKSDGSGKPPSANTPEHVHEGLTQAGFTHEGGGKYTNAAGEKVNVGKPAHGQQQINMYHADGTFKNSARVAAEPHLGGLPTYSTAESVGAFTRAPGVMKSALPSPMFKSVRAAIAKAEASTASMNDRPDSDFAYVEPGGKKDENGRTVPRSLRHFPIYDAAHTRNALSRAPQSPFGDKAMPALRAAAKKFGIEVAKEAAVDDLDTSTALAEPDGAVDGDLEAPGSPAWEAVDAATAQKWATILGRAKHALGLLADREVAEVGTDDGGIGDTESVYDLSEAACAIDCAIDILGRFAMGEQIESELAVDGAMVEKAGALTETSPHEESAADSAADPSNVGHGDDDDNHQGTTDAGDHGVSAPSGVITNSGVAKAEVAKGDLMAVFTQSGKMIGVVDPGKIQAVQTGEEEAKEPAAEEATETPEAEAAEAAPVAPADTAPAPSGTVGTPATEVAKSDIADVVKAAMAERDAQHASVVKALQDQIDALKAPAQSRVLSNGVLPPAHMLRGQDQTPDGATVDVAKAAEMRQRLEAAQDAGSRIAIENEMNEAASQALAALRSR